MNPKQTPDAPTTSAEIRAFAVCENCGWQHDVRLKALPRSWEVEQIHPRCWVCTHAPLVLIGKAAKKLVPAQQGRKVRTEPQ